MSAGANTKERLGGLCRGDKQLAPWLENMRTGDVIVESIINVADPHELHAHFKGMTQGWVGCQSYVWRYSKEFTLTGHSSTLLQAEACDNDSVSVHVLYDGNSWVVRRLRRVSTDKSLVSTTFWLARANGSVDGRPDLEAPSETEPGYAAYEIAWHLVPEPGMPDGFHVWRETTGRFIGWRNNNHA
jgi:hypothetical protein